MAIEREPGTLPVSAQTKALTTRLMDWASGLNLPIGATSARVGPLAGDEVAISPTTDCYVRIGNSSVTASAGAGSCFIAAGAGPMYFQMTTGSYVAAIQLSAGGAASVIPVA